MTDKRQIRLAARVTRDAFVRAGAPTIRVDPHFHAMLSPGLVVASYVPIGSEADPAPLEQAAEEANCQLALPHVIDRATPLHFLRWKRHAPLTAGPFGLMQPDMASSEVAPDIVLTPLVAFDGRLNRLGQGAGHYDRAFAAFPSARRIGVAWSVQRVDALTADPWDMPLHAIATEQDWITT